MPARHDAVVLLHRVGWYWSGRFAAMFVFLVIGAASGAASAPSSDASLWRSPARDGVNCLYLQLRLLGYTGTYEKVVEAVPGGADWPSLGALAQAARRLGFDLVPVKLNMTELSSLRSPVVILFEDAELGHGRFHLLLGFSPSTAHLVDGKLITRYEIDMPMDQFRRGWTGLALVSRSNASWQGRWIGVTIGGIVAGAIVWLACRYARRRQRLANISGG
jgi:hypothetical protein